MGKHRAGTPKPGDPGWWATLPVSTTEGETLNIYRSKHSGNPDPDRWLGLKIWLCVIVGLAAVAMLVITNL